MYGFVTLSILQFQFIEKGFKKPENCKHYVMLLLFLFTLERKMCGKVICKTTFMNRKLSSN